MKIRRIVAALQSQRPASERVPAIAELARRSDAELIGLFVEDIELLHFAGLPFAHEVGASSALRRKVDVGTMERLMRARAEELRSALAAALANDAVRWSFRVERGTIPRQVLAAGMEEPGPTLLLPPEVDLDQDVESVPVDELTEARLRDILQGTRPVLIVGPRQAGNA